MKNKILLSGLALAFATTLHAESFFSAPFDKNIDQFNQEMEKIIHNDKFFNFPSKYHMNFISEYPTMNAFEDKNSYTFEFELAGMDKSDIKVTLHNKNILTISGTKKELTKEEKKNLIKQERFYGSFNRSFTLPDDVDSNSIKVKYTNGILKVTIQKDTKKIKESVKNITIE